jgi:hypothetical protein
MSSLLKNGSLDFGDLKSGSSGSAFGAKGIGSPISNIIKQESES